jgi:hypothetical protein
MIVGREREAPQDEKPQVRGKTVGEGAQPFLFGVEDVFGIFRRGQDDRASDEPVPPGRGREGRREVRDGRASLFPEIDIGVVADLGQPELRDDPHGTETEPGPLLDPVVFLPEAPVGLPGEADAAQREEQEGGVTG